MPGTTHPQPSGMSVDSSGGPVVDPTRNVLDLVAAAVERLNDLRDADAIALRRELDDRKEARHREHTALQKHVETLIAAASNTSIMNERFSSVATQFKERDTRSERESKDNKVAVDAAFAAQKDAANEQNKANTTAIDKSEKATAETIKTNQSLSRTETAALAKSLEDQKERLGAVEAQLVGLAQLKQGGKDTVQGIYAFTGFLLSLLVIGGFLAAAGVFSRSPG